MRMKSILALSLLTLSTAFSATVAAQPQDESVVEERHWWPSFIPAFPAVCWADDQYFLLGVELGFGRQRTVFTTDFVAPTIAVPINYFAHYDSTIVTNGFLLGVLGGWQMRYCRFMFGIEANFDLPTSAFGRVRNFTFQDYTVTNSNWFAGTVQYERGPIFALTSRFGYFVTPGFFPYVRLGAQTSRNTATYQVNIGTNEFGVFPPIPFFTDTASHKKTLLGVVAGVGVEFPAFIGPSTVRIEYVFTKDQNLPISDYWLPIIGTDNFQALQTSILKASWVWNFV